MGRNKASLLPPQGIYRLVAEIIRCEKSFTGSCKCPRRNRELINQKRRERYQRQKAEKEMKIVEENLELTKPKKSKDRER